MNSCCFVFNKIEYLKWTSSLFRSLHNNSTRAASSSTAKEAGVPLMVILSTGGWSSERTFAKHYSISIKKENNFVEAIYNT